MLTIWGWVGELLRGDLKKAIDVSPHLVLLFVLVLLNLAKDLEFRDPLLREPDLVLLRLASVNLEFRGDERIPLVTEVDLAPLDDTILVFLSGDTPGEDEFDFRFPLNLLEALDFIF